ncbi:2OG-Fe(II) oxygenase superfamily protein [Pseudomassariella vexata]|uniref:2OG-Fe(II) oxygenase superfamily protein n=1 Tax=Pseudomassariella vexata TaxID=1141098 RepID=A0A1Y2EI12_9PEZI|nr:2OG-Fe(II) oxygenase superfamily protein [Pseudomassariella vexata]ORY71208.1 2OG-Fe(II) oxygenase superfamily protein [Pseudomassariella vexata]
MAEAAAIPIIDISTEGGDQAEVAKALVDAAAEHGFVYIKNTGKDITLEQIERAFEMSRTLFSSPIEEKQNCSIQTNNQGWSGMGTETLDPKSQRVGDFKEAFNFGPFTNNQANQPIPTAIIPYQPSIAAFRTSCNDFCRKLLHLFGIGLGVSPPDFFKTAHSPSLPSGSILRFLYYPSPDSSSSSGSTSFTAPQANDVRAGAHSDYGSVTLLFRLRGQAGLELLTGSGAWKPVPVCPPGTEDDPAPPILVNIGDLLSYWTNGLLRSTVHRVTFDGAAVEGESNREPRYSIAYFCHPANETKLTAVPSERVRGFKGGLEDAKEENPYAERKVMTADEHLQMRLQASYLELYEKK